VPFTLLAGQKHGRARELQVESRHLSFCLPPNTLPCLTGYGCVGDVHMHSLSVRAAQAFLAPLHKAILLAELVPLPGPHQAAEGNELAPLVHRCVHLLIRAARQVGYQRSTVTQATQLDEEDSPTKLHSHQSCINSVEQFFRDQSENTSNSALSSNSATEGATRCYLQSHGSSSTAMLCCKLICLGRN
jgi:hypothetical protein